MCQNTSLRHRLRVWPDAPSQYLAGAVIIREDGTYNLLLPGKQLDMALSFKHLMMMGFALGLGNEDKRMHMVPGTILNEAHDATQRSKKSGKRKEATPHAPRPAHGAKRKLIRV